MTEPTSSNNKPGGLRPSIMGGLAVVMFVAFIVSWIVGADTAITIAFGVVAIADAALFAFLSMKAGRTPLE